MNKNEFVLKATHDSEGVVVFEDTKNLNIDSINNILKDSLDLDVYTFEREWVYKNVESRIIAQQLLKDDERKY